MHGDLRAVVDAATQRQGDGRAVAVLEQLLRNSPTIATAQVVISRMRAVRPFKPMVSMRLAILRSFTLEPVIPLLKAAAILRGLDLDVWVGRFNTYAQDLLDPASELYRFDPEVVLLAVQARDLVPVMWDAVAELDQDLAANSVRQSIEVLRDIVGAFRSRCRGHVVIQNLELPDQPALGILDAQRATGQRQIMLELNRQLIALAGEMSGVYVLDYEALVARHGRQRWHDEQKWITARMPISADCLMPLAQEYLRFLLPLAGLTAKVLVVDLDNTLWGGVVAEDGIEGLQVGLEYRGAAHRDLQRAILSLKARGILLAIASKNNESDALEALDTHPGSLLRSRDFAAHRINWNDKAQSLREIANELNVGLDSIAFLDDSAAEREHVRMEVPEVTIIELPDEPLRYAQTLLDCPVFERLSLSDEDRDRDRLYGEQTERVDLERRTASLEEFLQSLEMEIEMREMSSDAVTRVAQLTQKTNQFNLTTRRYNEQEIQELAGHPSARVYQVRVRDRFGDNGLIGVVITRDNQDAWEIDTLLLSCRVIGRTIEQAMLARIASDAVAAGARRLRGWFVATKKNQPASSFYAGNGFSLVEGGESATLWELDLEASRPAAPAWIVWRN